jgi:catechol 2,3-dioxygenase-like lactoylglutathione lyase family enzyme
VAWVLLLTGAATAAPVAESDRVGLDLRRTTLVVADLDRSLAFYRDALGLVVTYDRLILSPRDAPSVEEAERARRLVLLRANDDYIGVLGLMQYLKPLRESADTAEKPFHPATPVMLFNLEDLTGTFQRARQVPGVTVLSEPSLVSYPSYDGRGTLEVMVSVVQDPDGFTVELNQLQGPLH